MRTKKLILPAITCLMILFSACPIGVKHPAGNKGKEKIDKKLIGTWTAVNTESEVKKVKISKATDYSYNVEVIEQGDLYSLSTSILTGWVTEIEGKKFFYAKPDDEDNYYLYNYSFDGDKLVTNDVSLKVNGVDGVTSTEAYREEIKQSLKFDDCLNGPITYTKE